MVTPDELKVLLEYNSETGEFTNLTFRKGARGKGKPAGTKMQNGYISICVNRKKLLAHRIAWAIVYGKFPSLELDHINGNRADNRICNLREVTRTQNHKNMKPRFAGKIPGIRKRKGKWHVQFRVGDKQKHIGSFSNEDEAIAALVSARKAAGYSDLHIGVPAT